jgi:2-keto-3-deoxy-galactonokinase
MTKVMRQLLVICLVGLATLRAGYAQTIQVDAPAGTKKLRDSQFVIGADLNVMLQLYPRQQYAKAQFFQSIVTAEYEEKQKELQNVKFPVRTKKLLKDQVADGLKGHGFVLVGENAKGEQAAICGYYLDHGENIVRVTIMGNGKTYAANTNQITTLLKGIKVK